MAESADQSSEAEPTVAPNTLATSLGLSTLRQVKLLCLIWFWRRTANR